MPKTKAEFKFQVNPKPGTGLRFTAVVHLTQEEFEDHQVKRAAIHAFITARGLKPSEVAWLEAPPVLPAVEDRLRELIGCDASAQLIHYYPHGWHHAHYKTVDVDGTTYRYMGFQNGHFIKYARELEQVAETV